MCTIFKSIFYSGCLRRYSLVSILCNYVASVLVFLLLQCFSFRWYILLVTIQHTSGPVISYPFFIFIHLPKIPPCTVVSSPSDISSQQFKVLRHGTLDFLLATARHGSVRYSSAQCGQTVGTIRYICHENGRVSPGQTILDEGKIQDTIKMQITRL